MHWRVQGFTDVDNEIYESDAAALPGSIFQWNDKFGLSELPSVDWSEAGILAVVPQFVP